MRIDLGHDFSRIDPIDLFAGFQHDCAEPIMTILRRDEVMDPAGGMDISGVYGKGSGYPRLGAISETHHGVTATRFEDAQYSWNRIPVLFGR